jgi:hypothetical protein
MCEGLVRSLCVDVRAGHTLEMGGEQFLIHTRLGHRRPVSWHRPPNSGINSATNSCGKEIGHCLAVHFILHVRLRVMGSVKEPEKRTAQTVIWHTTGAYHHSDVGPRIAGSRHAVLSSRMTSASLSSVMLNGL